MSFRPVAPPRLLTLAEYLAIGEIEPGYSELIEGRVLMSPTPLPDHSVVASELAFQLHRQLPAATSVIPAVDVDLQFAAADAPGTARRPDLVVVRRGALERLREEGGILRASEVLLVVEVLMPGAGRIDRIEKRRDYADAGIPHYWIVDPVDPVSLLACRLVGPDYSGTGAATGRFTATEPFDVAIDLDALL